MRRLRWATTLALAGLLILPVPAAAQIQINESVSIGVDDTVMQVQGQTSPYAFVTISDSGTVIGTATANNSGAFSQTFSAQHAGLHTLSMYAQTPGGTNTDSITVNLNVTGQTTTTAQVFLPSTVHIADTTLARGQPLVVNGQTAPAAKITIYIDNTGIATVQANSQGLWNISLSTASLHAGQHHLFTRATDAIGNQSYPSSQRAFSVAASAGLGSSGNPLPHPPAIPAITFPTGSTTWHSRDITVTGTAQPGVQVELWDAGQPIGAVWADSWGNWSLPLQLEPRSYAFKARACFLVRCSQFSPITTFTYDDGSFSPLERPLRIRVEQPSYSVFEGDPIELDAEILDGRPPYKTTLDWNDGRPESTQFLQNRLQYTRTYGEPGAFLATLDIRDADGRTARVYFAVHVRPKSTSWWWLVILASALLLSGLLILYYRKLHRSRAKPTLPNT